MKKVHLKLEKLRLKKVKKFFLPLIHHPFEVECCCSQHDIDVIAYDPFVKVTAEPMIIL